MKKQRNEAVVGFFVILSFIALTLLVFFVSGVYLFRQGYALNVMYDYVSILDRGAPVRMAGVRVGEVSDVKLIIPEGAGKMRVKVKLFIERGVEIGENYLFKIQGTHILSEPHIEISPQPGSQYMLKDGAIIDGTVLVAIESLISQADEILAKLNRTLGALQGAVSDEETSEAFKQIILNWGKLSKSLSASLDGSEEDIQKAIGDMRSSSESLSLILDRIEKGEGTLGKLLKEDELYVEMKGLVQEIKARPWRLLKKDGDRKFLGIF